MADNTDHILDHIPVVSIVVNSMFESRCSALTWEDVA